MSRARSLLTPEPTITHAAGSTSLSAKLNAEPNKTTTGAILSRLLTRIKGGYTGFGRTVARDFDELEQFAAAAGAHPARMARPRFVKTRGRSIKHARYCRRLLAESHLNRRLFAGMLSRIAALLSPAG